MKTITNPPQRTYWFVAAILTFVGLIFLVSCQKYAISQDNLIASAGGSNKVKIDKGLLKDADGNIYKTVVIGTQTWMAENLRTTKFNDGYSIPYVSSKGQWTDDPNWAAVHTPAYCYYDYDVKNGTTYGALYDWNAVNTGKLCPTGWHVPTDAEWTTLTEYLGEDVAGDLLREATNKYWINNFLEDTNPTNATRFTALPGGTFASIVLETIPTTTDEYFTGINLEGSWWTSSAVDYYSARYRYMAGNNSYVSGGDGTAFAFKSTASSVRCIKDTY
jgi:uncharacterized protein (TIGR02145 family)